MNQSLGHLTLSLPRFNHSSCLGIIFWENTLILGEILMNYSQLLWKVTFQVCFHERCIHIAFVFSLLKWLYPYFKAFHNIGKDARPSLNEPFCFWNIKQQLNAYSRAKACGYHEAKWEIDVNSINKSFLTYFTKILFSSKLH